MKDQKIEELRADILQAMKDLVTSAEDTVWIGQGETMFERLGYVYLKSEGDRSILEKSFPEYY